VSKKSTTLPFLLTFVFGQGNQHRFFYAEQNCNHISPIHRILFEYKEDQITMVCWLFLLKPAPSAHHPSFIGAWAAAGVEGMLFTVIALK